MHISLITVFTIQFKRLHVVTVGVIQTIPSKN